MSFRFSVVLNGLLGLVLVPFFAHAAVLEEVIVTAQKREQSVQDIGISITALNGEQLRRLGYANAQEVSALAASVSTIQPNGTSTYAFGIRGVVQNDFVSNQESPVSVYVDEVYVSQMAGTGFQLFDTERVEILRGPQGTLFGRNATGGLVHFVTRKPSQEFSGYGELTGGEYDQIKFQGAVGGGISETLSGRLSVATHHNSGYVENRLISQDINNANDYAARGQLLFTPNEDLEILLNVRGSLQQIRTGFFKNISSGPDASGVLGVNDRSASNFNGFRETSSDPFTGAFDKIGSQDMESYGFTGTVKWNLGDMLVTSITDFSHVFRDYAEDSDASPFPDFNFFQYTDADQFSQELRLNGETDRMRWVAGFFYLDVDINDANGAETPLLGLAAAGLLPPGGLTDGSGLLPTTEGDGTFQGNDNPYNTNINSWSIFGQVEYDLNEQFTGIVGFRWIEEEKKHFYENNFVDFQPGSRWRNGNPNILFNAGTYQGKYDEGLWSAKVELDWHPSDDLLLYASWNRGVKGGGFNAPLDITDPDPTNPTGFLPLNDALMKFQEEELDAFEVGFKTELFNGLARLNGSAYYYDYNDFHAFRIVGLSTFIFNADAEAKGFELELQSSPTEGLDVMFGVGYVDIDINDVDLGIGLGARDTKPVQSPKWNISGLARYEWPAFGGNMAIQGDFQYRSKHFFSLTQAQASTENGYAVANARLSYTTADDKWEAAVFVHNITDAEYLVQTFDLATVLGMTEQYFGPPRWAGGSVSYHW